MIFGDITTSRSEVIVSSDDFRLSMGGGVSAAIHQAAGRRLSADASKLTPLRVGDVAVSSAGHLPAKYVMHAVTLGPGADEISRDAVVRQVTQRALHLTAELGCSTIAFPAIGSGVAGIPFATVASQMAGAIVDHLLGLEGAIDVELYFWRKHWAGDEGELFPFLEAFAGSTRGLRMSGGPSGAMLSPPKMEAAPSTGAGTEDSGRQRQVYEMLRRLDARRDQLEADLFALLADGGDTAAEAMTLIRKQLEEIASLRELYASELDGMAAAAGKPPLGGSVFVSSTSADLKPHRTAVRSRVEALHLKFIGMEDFTPSVDAPATFICQKVDSAEVYVGILGMRYGSLDEATGMSMTEVEYRRALASGKPIQMFVMDGAAPITVDMVEHDPERFARLMALRDEVLHQHICGLFSGVEDLVCQVEAGLKEAFGRC